jgi:hypothetical protein
MKNIISVFCLSIMPLIAADAWAADATEVEGTYFMVQADGHQRAVSFDRSGNMVVVSSLESVVGFTSGVGAWESTGSDTASARIVNFNFNIADGEHMGPAIATYMFAFSDKASGKYQKFTGSLSGVQYDVGQNPLDPSEEPYREFGITFEGTRITAQ